MSSEPPSYEPQQSPLEPGTGAEAAEARIGGFARLFNVFTSPGEVFADIARKPTWVWCLVLTTLLAVGAQLAAIPHVDMEATIRARMAERSTELTDEQMDTILQRADKFAYVGPIASVVIVPLAMVILGAIYLLGAKMSGSDTDFLHTFSATLHAYWPSGLVKGILAVVLMQRIGKLPVDELKELVKSNLGAFLSPDAPKWLGALASTVDIFNLWAIALLVIGLSVVGGIPRKRAGVVVGVVWLLWIAGKVGVAFIRP